MTVKDEYEYLKTDLMIRLSETTEACNLDCPFNFRFSKEEENKFLPRGTMGRLAVKRAFIILDNTYKKVRLYPTDEFINIEDLPYKFRSVLQIPAPADQFREGMDLQIRGLHIRDRIGRNQDRRYAKRLCPGQICGTVINEDRLFCTASAFLQGIQIHFGIRLKDPQ